MLCGNVVAGTGQAIAVRVTNRASTSTLLFAYSSPTLVSILPSPVPVTATTIWLFGTNFGASGLGAATVTLLGGTCTGVIKNDTTIQCTPPTRKAGASAAGYVTISTQNSGTVALDWVAPVLSSLS